MMGVYEARWEAAKKLVCDFKDKCVKEGVSAIWYDGDFIDLDKLIIEGNDIYLLHESEGSRCRYMIFENDKDYAHGLEKTVKEFRDEFLSSAKAYKQIKIY